MTATKPALSDALPDYEGEKVLHCTVKFTGLGTGFAGLDVAPIAMDLDDVEYFVIKVVNKESPSHGRNKDDQLVRHHRVSVEQMALVSSEIAQKALQEYAEMIEAKKAEIDGQTSIDDELAAQKREEKDATDAPTDIAAAAAKRVKSGK